MMDAKELYALLLLVFLCGMAVGTEHAEAIRNSVVWMLITLEQMTP